MSSVGQVSKSKRGSHTSNRRKTKRSMGEKERKIMGKDTVTANQRCHQAAADDAVAETGPTRLSH